nr:MAG TPA: hypothetical protein [Caudoviricetes sp.]
MIGRTNAGFGGGGGGLRVAVGLTAPSSPRENTVWVKSDKAGKKYVFAEAAPEAPAEGLIWFSATGDGIITQANVYADGAWNRVDAYMYLSGAWVHIASAVVYLYNKGDTCDAVSGGWEAAPWRINSGAPGSTPSLTKVDGGLTVSPTYGREGLWGTRASVNLDKIRKVCAVIRGNANANNNLVVSTGSGEIGFPPNVKASKDLFNGTVELDVSALSGKYFVGFRVRGNFTVEAVWLSY